MLKILSIAALLFAGIAGAATVTVNPGQTIQSGIATAASGDTVVVNAGTYSGGINGKTGVRVQASGYVTVNGGANLVCNQCSVIGFHFVKGSVWIAGDDVLFEGNELNGMGGDEDYGNVFGNRITVRRNYFHGIKIPKFIGDVSDIGSGPEYMHNDVLQYWDNNGEVLRDIIIEENIMTDFVQGIFLANETGTLSRSSNWTIRNNVLWGTDFVENGNLLGGPSNGIFAGKYNVPDVVIRNNTVHKGGNSTYLYGVQSAIVQGNIYSRGGTVYATGGGTPASAFNRGTVGNVLWSNSWNGYPAQGPDKYIDPQFQSLTSLLGGDALPFTADDGWRALNPLAAGYGAQIAAGGTPPPPPPPPPPPGPNTAPTLTLNGPTQAIQLTSGQTQATFTITANGADAQTPSASLAYLWAGGTNINTITAYQPAGVQGYSCTVTDGGGLTATATLAVTVLPYLAPPPPPPAPAPVITWNRIRVYRTDGTLLGYRWAQTTTTDVKPVTP